MKTSNQLCMLVVIATSISACGSTAPTQQLVDARSAMDEARASEASELTPAKLLTAEQALNRAEKAHEDDAGSDKEAHLAYLASRKAHIALAHGKIAAAKKTQMEAEAAYESGLKRVAETSSSKLDATQAALQNEQEKRVRAEQLAAAALASLQRVATVKSESRGTVITLPGGVLFSTGGSSLSTNARDRLGQVVDALKQQPTDHKIVVEGHTDDRGSDEANQQLSQARADAVRSYMIEQGLSEGRVQAIGKGETEPIASNDSSADRATNRRVEFILAKPENQTSAAAQPSSTSMPQ